ncbi:MAG: hypothetical protein JW936_03410 [Sedimentisphaerales bacterium]|nr:hypothetical protein [Sedimentisphaerales bacterium]
MENDQANLPKNTHRPSILLRYFIGILAIISAPGTFSFLVIPAILPTAFIYAAEAQDQTPRGISEPDNFSESASQPPVPATQTDPLGPLFDVQDRIDTIVQAGLWSLLDTASTTRDNSQQPASPTQPPLSISPEAIVSDPQAYRGQRVSFTAVLHPTIEQIIVDRPRLGEHTLYYVTAQIPFGQNQRMPAILLSPDPLPNITIDQQEVSGYFYMILRAPTQASPGSSDAKQLDFLVFVLQSMTPAAKDSDDTQDFGFADKQIWWAGSLLILTATWIWLRRRMATFHKDKGQRR